METELLKLLVPDYAARKKRTYEKYHELKCFYKKNKKNLSELWDVLVVEFAPKNIDLGDWKSFLRKKKSSIIMYKESPPPTLFKHLDMLEDAQKRVSEEARILGGGVEKEGFWYLEKYLTE